MSPALTSQGLFGVAGVQMSVSAFDDNVDRMGAYLRHIRARFPWVRLVMFSELAALGPKLAKAEPLPGPTETRLAALARDTGLWLVPGSLFEKVVGPEGERFYNTTPVINPQGEVIARFRGFAEQQPKNGRAQYYYAMSLWKGKRTQDSGLDMVQVDALLKKANALDPALADAHLQLGNLYSDQHKYRDAIPEYQRALEIDSDLADAHYRLGQAYVHIGKKDKAQEQLQAYQKLREQHLAEVDRQRAEVRQFVYAAKDAQSGRQ